MHANCRDGRRRRRNCLQSTAGRPEGVCDTCKASLSVHSGSAGGVKCHRRVFSSEIQTVHDQLKQLTTKLSAELEETHDRESRLTRLIEDLKLEVLNARDDYQQALKQIEALDREKEKVVKQPSAGAEESRALTKGQLRQKPKEKPVQQSDSWADR